MKHLASFITTLVWFFSFWSFIAIKAGGTALAAWSWWWMLLSIVPMLSLVFNHFGL